ncbi:hypothetical protein C2S52_020944 [Perilla frutescens var. hirtella]|nr:hypothetical protein C2S52_020944 [Perilla frutescens var. hirtella]KAH6804957.1 hypothetical protein C2S51_029788 [Perilla frutescens var. frutescens]
MDSNSRFLSQKLTSLIQAVSLFLIPFFSYFLRLQKSGFSSKKHDKDMIILEAEREAENDGDKSELHLKFKFPTFDEFNRIQKGRGDSFNPKLLSFASTNPNEFAPSRRSVSAFIEVLTTFPLREINGDRNGAVSDFFSGPKIVKVDEETEGVEKRGEELLVGLDGEGNGKNDATEFAESKVHSLPELVRENQDFVDESEFFSERSSDGFLSDGDFGEGLDVDSENEDIVLESDASSLGENKESSRFVGDGVSEIKKVEEHDELQNADFLSEKDFKVNSDKNSGDGFLSVDDDNAEKSKRNEPLISDCGDANKLESMWEHQELIEQLQMELRKVKATGLPTILEESESPKIIDDLKLWKIDDNDKLQHEDCIGELHKFYKSYREMMRKFDILNYQKMYAMGFLQLKDPFQPTSQHKTDSAPMLKALVSQNLWLFKHKKHGSNPIKKLINELEGDLEVVYVGQMCLSWEFMHWQYEKALELWNSDPLGVHRYNEVAGELQQFQVLVQRFTEDEPFQGPRVQSYVKSRCVLRNLLQVPVIREDCLEDQSRKKERDEYVITSEMLVEMVEESIRIFWRFVRSDKDCTIASSSGHKKLPELHSPEDLKLLTELRKILQKKERKLKDILRSESCILRKFQKQREEDESDQALQFYAQVDVKLVSRVLNMSRITRDQLIWCQSKLSRISFVNRKIYVEPTFLLFPC